MIKKQDILTAIPFIIVAVATIYYSPNLWVILEAVGLTALLVISSHFMRKLAFWGHSTTELFKKAKEDPVASAIVYSAIIFFTSQIFTTVLHFLK